MTLEELIKVKESLEELEATAEKFDWGPSQAFAQQRQKEAIRIVKREIKRLKNEDRKYVQSQLGYSRIGRNNI
jgi:hypothetical protein